MVQTNRRLTETISARLGEKTPLIQVIIGPRQVGKTTALRAVLPKDAVFESADSAIPLPYTSIEDWWKQALKTQSRILAIDEVQKIPGWTEVLKRLWDQTLSRPKVVVTGSSSMLMEKGLRESLAGRFELIRAEHWHYQEAKNIFGLTLDEYIEFGCYPGSVPLLRQDLDRWGQYVRDAIVEPALGRDLLQLYPVEQPALLRQLFGAAISLPGQIVSLQKMQGQLQGQGTLPTLQNYLRLLADAFLVTGIEKFSSALFRVKKSPPKLIVHDNALIRAFERPIQKKPTAESWGHYFENSIGARLIEAGFDTYYWKDRDDEVDFVVVGPNNEKWAIEVKTSNTSEKELKGVFAFCKIYKDFEPVLVSRKNQKLAGVKTIPTEEILSLHRRYPS